jgi:hypothetical protein
VQEGLGGAHDKWRENRTRERYNRPAQDNPACYRVPEKQPRCGLLLALNCHDFRPSLGLDAARRSIEILRCRVIPD